MNNISVILDTVNKLSKNVAEVVARVEHVAASFGSHGLTDQAITQAVTDNNVKAHSVSGIKTYAAVTTANIPEVVKSAVETTLKSQRINDQIECSLAFYNVPEGTNDNVEVSEIWKLMECAIKIVSIKRIGQKKKELKTLRPIKIILNSRYGRDFVLMQVKDLKNSSKSYIRIGKWLSSDDQSKIKDMRRRCEELNNSAPKRPDNKHLFVLVSGKIMKSSVDGSFKPYKEDSVRTKLERKSSSIGEAANNANNKPKN